MKTRRGADLRRLLKKLKAGDNCQGCGRPYQHHEETRAGYDEGGKLLNVGECCAGRLTSIIAGSIYFAPGSAEVAATNSLPPGAPVNIRGTAWSEDDRKWFAAHPERAHRVRPGFPGEFPEGTIVVVRQQAPGTRLRLPIAVPPPPVEIDEEAAWAMFDVVFEAQKRGIVPSVAAIEERYALLKAAKSKPQ
jgi:hypothetical protein